jgi:hypothetical protein
MPRIKLSDIIDAMQMQSETVSCYLNKKTRELVPISEEDMDAAEDDELAEDAPEGQEEGIQTARAMLDTGNYIALPSQFDIDEYSMMERFCLSIKDQKIADSLFDTIKGRGAFRRFKDKVHEYGVEQDWYKHRDCSCLEIAKAWCEENGIEFMED